MSPNGDIQKIRTSHDIGIVTAAKLVGICWAGLVPVVFPAWLIIQGEIRFENHAQDVEISKSYVSRVEFDTLKDAIKELRDEVHKLREAVITNAQNGSQRR